jgi:hypothetical protein
MANPENNIEEIFEKKFYCSSRFAEEIETIVKNNPSMRYVDAIVHFCEINEVDYDSIPKLISKPLKEKLKCEAMEFNFLKKTSHAKLPL